MPHNSDEADAFFLRGVGIARTLPANTEVLAYNSTTGLYTPTVVTGLGGAPSNAQYVTLAVNTTLTVERVLTGTANQITITDNGAGSTVVLSTPQNLHTAANPTFNDPIFRRLKLTGGTNIVAGDVVAGAGWGASATVSAVAGKDSRGSITITTNAADTPGANPTLVLTFKDGTFTTTPFGVVCMDHSSTGPSTVPVTCVASATTLTISYRGTPTATSTLTYIFNFIVLG